MIGVIADPSDHAVVREFFELFKTPWEFYRSNEQYDVVLCAGGQKPGAIPAKLVLVYAGEHTPFDADANVTVGSALNGAMLLYRGDHLPVYGACVTFRKDGIDLKEQASGQPAACLIRSGDRVVARIGCDVFGEIRTALTTGQPPANASMPSVEMHIALLRDLIIHWAPPLIEIPPVPEGYRFIACLTHDVDHPSLRRHRLDHTTFGFLYRAVIGSVADCLRGRASMRKIIANWIAALKLPFVHLGLAKDPWAEFDRRYLELERGLGSTFFVIPHKDDPGQTAAGPAPAFRASPYGAADIAAQIHALQSAGCEIGVHGIDAWRDSAKGRAELRTLSQVTSDSESGVRMHWLYADAKSPSTLEEAGFTFDSTMGYNETVGYRAGTTQAFKPLGAARLLELPLHVMDTALFYPDHLHLPAAEARERVRRIADNAVRFGGCVTVNWHDRSLAPERLWGDFYQDLLSDLKRQGAWFPKASDAVAWFRKRRSATFESVATESGELFVKIRIEEGSKLPGLRLRIHRLGSAHQSPRSALSPSYEDVPVSRSMDARIALQGPHPAVVGS